MRREVSFHRDWNLAVYPPPAKPLSEAGVVLRVASLGVRPDPISRKKLTVDRLARAINRAVTEKEMR